MPYLINELVKCLSKHTVAISSEGLERASVHGRLRRDQGYSVSMVVEETRLLFKVISQVLQENLLSIDISSVIPDLVRLSDTLSELLVQSLNSFQSPAPMAA